MPPEDDVTYRNTKIPIEVVRDLLGIARALYATFQKLGPGHGEQLLKLRGIGSQLTLAIKRAGEGGPGTFPHRAAWLISEKAAKDLGELVDLYLPAKHLITATGERLVKKR